MERAGRVVERFDEGILRLELDRPEKLNALIEPMRSELCVALEALRTREEVRVCVITGRGRGFCAGGDIEVMQRIIREERWDELQTFLAWGRSIVTTIRSLPIPVIAAVNGPAAGAGMNLALACDLRIASDAATFSQSFVHIGLHPDWGGTYLLPRIVGPSRALELFWTGRTMDAAEAGRLGLVDRVVPAADLEAHVSELSRRLAAQPREVLALTKLGVHAGTHDDLDAALRHEEAAQARCIRTGSAQAGMDRFLATRRARRAS